MTKGIFITGTDTGVGKTVVAAGLACLLSRQEKKTAVMKPVQTGGVWQNGRLISEDLELLKSGISLNEPQELLNPYCFPEPCSPHLAARLAGTKIEPGKIIGAYGQLALKYERVIVEGAGGLLVPLTEKYLLADLVRDLNLPLVIVVSNRLGVINHAVLTVECARQRGLEILGIVINHTQSAEITPALQDNPQIVAQVAKVPILAILPYMAEGDLVQRAADLLERIDL